MALSKLDTQEWEIMSILNGVGLGIIPVNPDDWLELLSGLQGMMRGVFQLESGEQGTQHF